MCEEALASNLTVENVASILIIADMHNAAQLKKIALHFCSSNSNTVPTTEGWKQMVSQNPSLLSDAYESLGNISSLICKYMYVQKIYESTRKL